MIEHLTGSERVDTKGLRAAEVIISMITRDFSVISIGVTGVSLFISVSTTTHKSTSHYLTWPFLWSCGWSILYVSSVLLLHDSLHSLFTPVCLSVT